MKSHGATKFIWLLAAVACAGPAPSSAQPTGALLASLLSGASARQQPQQPQPSFPVANANANNLPLEPLTNSSATPPPLAQQLGAMQAQAQRQFNQLVNSPIAANLTAAGAKYASNALEVLSNVGKAIQQQIAAASSHHQINVMAPNAPATGDTRFLDANTKKNEYLSVPADAASGPQVNASSTPLATNYREQGEQLRVEIARRVGQLQQVVASSMDMMKNNGDLIVRRLLEQLNHRLDQAKSKADKIITEPATNEVAIKALVTINQGLNNLNNIITNIVTRLEASAKENAAANQAQAAQVQGAAAQRVSTSLFDASKFRLNFQQLGQQFSSALGAVQRQQQQQPVAAPTGLKPQPAQAPGAVAAPATQTM